MRDPDFTFSAGPTAASARVLAALGSPIVYHYDPAFLEGFRRTERKLAEIFLTENDVLLMQGEAVLGLEAAARSLVQPGTPVLNLVSGVFGKGMGYWLKDFGADLHELEVPYNDAVDPADVERYLDEHPEIELVTVVHSETPSGTLHDLSAIGPIARAHGALTLVDCVSSLGGIRFETDAWQLDVCVAGAAEVPRGPSRHVADDRQRRGLGANPREPGRAARLVPLDARLEGAVDRRREVPVHAVGQRHPRRRGRLRRAARGGSRERRSRATTLAARACRAGASAMGLELWPRSDEIAAACVTAIAVPDGLTDVQVRDHCRERYGVMISAGQGAGNLVRIGHMGVTARSLYPVVGLAALGRGRSPTSVSPSRSAPVSRRPWRCSRRRRRSARDAARRSTCTAHGRSRRRPLSATVSATSAAFYCGGTELLLLLKLGFASFGHLVDLKGIEELRGIRAENGTLVVGAATTHREIESDPFVRERLPGLADMERRVANLRVRNAGTLGGNLCFSDPHSDPATFLLAVDGEVECRRGGGRPRRLPVADFVVGPYQTVLEPGEILTSIRIPVPPPGVAIAHEKFAIHEWPAATVTCLVRVETGRVAEARVAVGSVGVRPARAGEAERLLQGLDAARPDERALGQAGAAAAEAAAPVEDPNGSVEYKENLVAVLVRRAFRRALEAA